MKKTMGVNIFAMALLSTLLLGSCARLITPNFKTELVSLKEGQYQLDPKHTAVLFKVNHMGFSKFVGRFGEVDASLNFDPDDITGSSLEATINMGSINVNNARFEKTLKGSDWLNVESHPQAFFRTSRAEHNEGNRVKFNGELTFLGVTQPLAIVVTFNGGANNMLTGKYTLGFEASTLFKRSDFGLNKYSGVVGDDIEIEVHAEFQRIR